MTCWKLRWFLVGCHILRLRNMCGTPGNAMEIFNIFGRAPACQTSVMLCVNVGTPFGLCAPIGRKTWPSFLWEQNNYDAQTAPILTYFAFQINDHLWHNTGNILRPVTDIVVKKNSNNSRTEAPSQIQRHM